VQIGLQKPLTITPSLSHLKLGFQILGERHITCSKSLSSFFNGLHHLQRQCLPYSGALVFLALDTEEQCISIPGWRSERLDRAW
jgi:hypothetical protein